MDCNKALMSEHDTYKVFACFLVTYLRAVMKPANHKDDDKYESHPTRESTIYFQYGYYTKEQMHFLQNMWNTPQTVHKYTTQLLFSSTGLQREFGVSIPIPMEIATICGQYYCGKLYTSFDLNYYGLIPKLLFADHFNDKYRWNAVQRRFVKEGQSKVLGDYDKTFGFGICTKFKLNIYDIGFEKWAELMDTEFGILAHHLQCGGDVVIPIPSFKELKENRNLYFDQKTSMKVINHTLGTGIARLPFHFRKYIQSLINMLCEIADNTETVECALPMPH